MNSLLENFCMQSGVLSPLQLTPIRSGRNSAVYQVTCHQQKLILKHYFQHEGDKRDRLNSEYQFLSFLNRGKCALVAQPIAKDEQNNLALYSFLPGAQPIGITDSHIHQAASFILFLESLKTHPNACNLPNAADSCTHIQQHIDLVSRRIQQLEQIQNSSAEVGDFISFLQSELTPVWKNIQNEITRNFHGEFDAQQLLTISPSDFGFHNTLEFENTLSFIDFEYAGWDSIAKLVCDFICQPELPISEQQASMFIKQIDHLVNDPNLVEQVNLLLPLHRLKWCCILLNVFREVDKQRRAHSGVNIDNLQKQQLIKAKCYFEQHLSRFK